MKHAPDILCIGSVLWDQIGRTGIAMPPGADRPGRIERLPGGVAMNIARTLAGFGLRPALLTAIGQDDDGAALMRACAALGLDTDHVLRPADLPTDRYMAIEGPDGLVAAIADAHSLEAAGAAILSPLIEGPLGSDADPWSGMVALDGNLTEALLAEIAESPLFAEADLRVAPASPGKAERLLPLLDHPRATFYVNLEEAGILAGQTRTSARDAALALSARGMRRVLVTDGGRPCALAREGEVIEASPPEVLVTRVTGAGDTFMAAHIAAETRGDPPEAALAAALSAAASFVSGDIP